MPVALTRTRSIFAGAIAVAGLALAFGPAVQADQHGRCSVRQAAGHYGVLGSGTILAGNPLGLPAGPFTTAGVADFRADGTWIGKQTASFNGSVVVDVPIGGRWSVTSDCVFSNTEGSRDAADSGRGAVVNDGREIDFMDSGAGVAATFVARRT